MPPSEPKTLDDVLDEVDDASSGSDGEDTAFVPANDSEDSEDDDGVDDDTEVVNTDDDDEDEDTTADDASSTRIQRGSVIRIEMMSGASVEGHVYRPGGEDIKKWDDVGFALIVDPQRGPAHKTTVAFTTSGTEFYQIDPTEELRLMREHWLTDNKRFTMKVMLKRIDELRSNPMLTGKAHMPIINKFLKCRPHKGSRPHVIIVLSTLAFEVAKSTLQEQEKKREKKKPAVKQEAKQTAKPEVKQEVPSAAKQEATPVVKEEGRINLAR